MKKTSSILSFLCINWILIFQDPSFSDCSCVLESMLANTSMNSSQSGNGSDQVSSAASAAAGFCDREQQCRLVAVFLVSVGLAALFQYIRAVPFVYVSIR